MFHASFNIDCGTGAYAGQLPKQPRNNAIGAFPHAQFNGQSSLHRQLQAPTTHPTPSCHFPPFVCAGVLLSSESHSVGTIYKRAQRWRNYDAISAQKTEPVDATHRPVRSGWMFSFARARGGGVVGFCGFTEHFYSATVEGPDSASTPLGKERKQAQSSCFPPLSLLLYCSVKLWISKQRSGE